jgi:hypothetical protein
MDTMIREHALETQVDLWMTKYGTAVEPMECGHPGACADEHGCRWCRDLTSQDKPTKKRGYTPRAYTDVLTNHQAECFADIWEAWPINRDDGKKAKGDKFRAMEAFASACASGHKPEDLVEAGARYLTKYEQDRGGFLQMVATFYGPMKRTYMTYMEQE